MVTVARAEMRLLPDPRRVVARPFLPGAPTFGDGPSRVQAIVDRVVTLDEDEASLMLEDVRRRFRDRHANLDQAWMDHAAAALAAAGRPDLGLSPPRRLLLGAYFTQEYALEAAALTNPSIVSAPEGGARVVVSLRAIGEGHISSVEFRTGEVTAGGELRLDEPHPHLDPGSRQSPLYVRTEFMERLLELGADPELTRRISSLLDEEFNLGDLDRAASEVRAEGVSEAAMFETVRLLHWVATSNYEVVFGDVPLSGRVLVPAGPADSRGIEDVRLVRFVDDDGQVTYFGTYTAYDGFTILPQLIATADFRVFRIMTMSGPGTRNKGMALFPRRIDGSFVALGRIDRESIFVLRSKRVRSWSEAELVYAPRQPWESVQIGNCGPPLETERGWLVLTHGVGPMRTYSLGAILLDRDQPERLVAHLTEPLLQASADERDGYVPNVVYTCGGLLHHRRLIIPYGFADRGVSAVSVDLDDLLSAMRPP